MPDLHLPLRQYTRPHGCSAVVKCVLPDAWTQQRADALELLKEHGIEFTAELLLPGTISVCLDDGDFDYRAELAAPDEVTNIMLRFLDKFDVEDYRSAAAAMAEQEA